MNDDLWAELSFGEGLSGCDWGDWLVDWQTRLASWMQDVDHRRRLT